jgi:hypothetical protein
MMAMVMDVRELTGEELEFVSGGAVFGTREYAEYIRKLLERLRQAGVPGG